jgi:hypothetical protein
LHLLGWFLSGFIQMVTIQCICNNIAADLDKIVVWWQAVLKAIAI